VINMYYNANNQPSISELEKKLIKIKTELIGTVVSDENQIRRINILINIARLKSSIYPIFFFWGCALSELLMSYLSQIKTYVPFELEASDTSDLDMEKLYREGKRHEHVKIPTKISDGLYELYKNGHNPRILGCAAGYWRYMLILFNNKFERLTY